MSCANNVTTFCSTDLLHYVCLNCITDTIQMAERSAANTFPDDRMLATPDLTSLHERS